MKIYHYDDDGVFISEDIAETVIEPDVIETLTDDEGNITTKIIKGKSRVVIPANATTKAPPKSNDKLAVFDGVKWELKEDNRGKIVFHKTLKEEFVVDYIGSLRDEHTIEAPDEWDEWDSKNKKWKQKKLEGDELEQFLKDNFFTIDKETQDKIFEGFVYDSKTFSMSLSAQSNWLYLLTQYQAGVFSETGWGIATKNDDEYLLLKNKAVGFFTAASTHKETILKEGREKKRELRKKYEQSKETTTQSTAEQTTEETT